MANTNTPEEFAAWLDLQAGLLDKGLISQQEYNDAVNDAKAGMKGYTAQLRASTAQLKKSFLELGSAMVKGEEGAAVYNNSVNSAANAIDSFASKFGIIGKVIGSLVTAGAKYATAVNDQADALFKNYKELSRNGLATGMEDTFKNLQSMGYTAAEIGKMGDMMKENATVFANFGGTAATGAKQFAAAAKEIQFSDVGNQFKLMGMSVDDINKGMAGYMKIQQNSGSLQKQSTAEIAESAQRYMMNQDKLTKLTGISADKQNDILMQAQADQRYAATQAELRANGDAKSLAIAQRNDDLLVSLTAEAGPKTAKAFQDFASGMMNSEDAQKFRRTYGSAADMISKGVTDKAAIMDAARRDAKTASANWSTQAKAGNANQYIADFAENTKMAGLAAGQSAKEAEAAAQQEQDAQKAGKDKGTKNMVDLTTAQRNQTQVTDLAVNKGIVPVTKGMAALAESLESATDVVGKLSGREGKLGDKTKPGPSSSAPSAQPAQPASSTSTGAPAGAAGLAEKLSAAGITGKGAQANILAQISAESGGVAKSENLNYSPERLLAMFPNQVKTIEQAKQIVAQGPEAIGNVIYGGRMGNAANEGYKYRGRGLIQLTGKDNYAKFSQLVGVDLLKNPDLANDPEIAQKIAVAYFKEAEKRGTNLSDINQVGKAVGYQDKSGAETAKRAQIAQNIQAGNKSAASGGILSGPKGGYEAMLHGTEAVIPLPDGKTIPVQMSGGGGSSPEQLHLLSQELGKLEMLVRIVQRNNDITTKILQRHS